MLELDDPITLEPADYPEPPATMLNLVPANASGAVDLGAPFLDRETVQALHDAVVSGLFTLDPSWNDALASSTHGELEGRFLERLRGTKLSPISPALHHRRLALFEAVREVGTNGSIPGFGFGVHNLTRAIGDVETWLEGKRQEFQALGLPDAEIVRMLAMLTPRELAALLQVTEATLSQWREAKRGPAYAQLGQRSNRYPVAAVLEWLKQNLGGTQ